MSRTYKDKPYKLRNIDAWDKDRVMVRCEAICYDWLTKEPRTYIATRYLEGKTTKTKKRREVDTEDHWMTTPMWWIHMWHTRPERRKAKMLLTSLPADLEEVDVPDTGHKPHHYFW